MNQIIKDRIEEINSGRVPEGYKQTPFGIFPCDWDIKKLSEVCDIYSGGTPSTSKSEYWDGEIPWCSPTDITKSKKYITKTERNITKQGLDNSSAILMPINSILMCSRATIGPRCINKVPMATNQGFKNLVCNNSNDTEFIYYLLDMLILRFIKTSNGSTFLELSKSELEKAGYCLPKKEDERVHIAGILMKWDEMVELQEQYITKLEIRKKSVMKKLLTPKDDWNWVQMCELGTLYQPQTISDSQLKENGYLVYGANGVIGFYEKYNHENSEIAITCRGSTCGVVTFTEPKSWITGNAMVFKVSTEYNKKFLYYLCAERGFKDIISGSGQPQITRQAFSNVIFKIPKTKDEQKLISKILSKADEEISLQKGKLEKIKAQRKILQQYLLTGIVRVV